MAAANRAFLTQAVRHLAGEVGIRQFLDVGTGIPTSPNVHEVARAAARTVGWCTSTTTRSSWPMPVPC
jgi:S-adenosyl methyltransferase